MAEKITQGHLGNRTEDEFLGRRKHVKGECDFILVFLELKPSDEGGDVGDSLSRGWPSVYCRHSCEWKGCETVGARRGLAECREIAEGDVSAHSNEWKGHLVQDLSVPYLLCAKN